jgi:hypothetical protein
MASDINPPGIHGTMKLISICGKKLSTSNASLLLLFLAALLSGCASSQPMAWNAVHISALGMPAPGQAKVVFLRPSHFAYKLHFRIHDGEQMIGRSSGSSFFTYECAPGHHVFSSSMDNMEILNADLLPDRIYYVKVSATMGMWVGDVTMTPLYPTSKEIKWEQLAGTLGRLSKNTISSADQAADMKNIEGYMERLKKHQAEADKHGQKILPEYGQSSPLQ